MPRSSKFANYTLVGKKAAQLFLDATENGCVPHIPMDPQGKRTADANKCFKAMKAMATTAEFDLLRASQREETVAIQIVLGLVKLLCVRIREAYVGIGKEAPKEFGKTPPLVSTMAENITKSKLDVESSSITAWRKKHESPQTSVPPPPVQSQPPPADGADGGPPSKRLRMMQPATQGKGDDEEASDSDDEDASDSDDEDASDDEGDSDDSGDDDLGNSPSYGASTADAIQLDSEEEEVSDEEEVEEG